MILQSRKWRLLIRVATLLVTSLVMLAFAGPASYALQDDTPKLITGPVELTNKEEPIANSYANATALPDMAKAFAVEEVGVTYYWIPLRGYNNKLFVRTKNVSYALPNNYVPGITTHRETYYEGKITTLDSQLTSEKVIEELEARGISVEKGEAMVLQQGEKPSAYRPMVPVFPVLAWVWLAALAGLIQIGRGRQPKRRLSTASVAARNIR
ncbi:MAG: hypothetical protein ABIO92_02405 [Chloroflexia bacterium]